MVLLHYRVIPGLDVPRPQPEPVVALVPTPAELPDCDQATAPLADPA